MIADPELGILFIAIPKTGSTAVEFALQQHLSRAAVKQHKRSWRKVKLDSRFTDLPINPKHMPLIEIQKRFWHGGLFSFSFVRNPWQREFSLYHQLRKRNDQHIRYRKLEYHMTNMLTFPEWIRVRRTYVHLKYGDPMGRYMVPLKGHPHVDFVGRFESLQEDFDMVCDITGIPSTKLPEVNKSKHRSYTDAYTNRARKWVAHMYRKDLERWSYKFGD